MAKESQNNTFRKPQKSPRKKINKHKTSKRPTRPPIREFGNKIQKFHERRNSKKFATKVSAAAFPSSTKPIPGDEI